MGLGAGCCGQDTLPLGDFLSVKWGDEAVTRVSSHPASYIRGPRTCSWISLLSPTLEIPQATQSGLWRPDPHETSTCWSQWPELCFGGPAVPRGEARASKYTRVLQDHVSGTPLKRHKCPLRLLAELQGGEWGCLQDTSGIATWPAGTSGLTHFPFKRGMSRSVELPLPGSGRPA